MNRESLTTTLRELPQYELKSGLAAYCLPKSNREDLRGLAWANSVCLMFVVVGALGLHEPPHRLREAGLPPPPPNTVILLPPLQTEAPTDDVLSESLPDEVRNDLPETLVIEPVLVADPNEVAFPVPIEGYVALAPEARWVPPPPAIVPRAPPPEMKPIQFQAIRFGGKEFRRQPPPNYPEEFQRQRVGGTIEALISVETNGVPSRVEVGRTSGHAALDRHVCDFIRREWRARPGEAAYYRIAITFVP